MEPPQSLKPKIRISAPGKVILHGEHSVVFGKLAVAASLGLRTKLEYYECDSDDVIRINFDGINLTNVYQIKDVQAFLQTPLPLMSAPSSYNITQPELIDHVTALEIVKKFVTVKSTSDSRQVVAVTSFFYLMWALLGSTDLTVTSFDVRLTSELTIGAGTGSSASFAVTIAAFFLQLIRIKQLQSKSPYKASTVHNANPLCFDTTELELISKWAFESERIVHGTPSGVDNTICTFGGLVEFRRNQTPKLVALSKKFKLLLINTNVSRDTRNMVKRAADRRQKYPMTVDRVLDCMDEIAVKAIECMRKINEGVENDYETLEELADMNQSLLACLGVSHPKLDEICLILHQNGLKGKLTGAGGGGYAICLVPPYVTDDLVEKVLGELNVRGLAAVLTDLGGCGVSVDSI